MREQRALLMTGKGSWPGGAAKGWRKWPPQAFLCGYWRCRTSIFRVACEGCRPLPPTNPHHGPWPAVTEQGSLSWRCQLCSHPPSDSPSVNCRDGPGRDLCLDSGSFQLSFLVLSADEYFWSAGQERPVALACQACQDLFGTHTEVTLVRAPWD